MENIGLKIGETIAKLRTNAGFTQSELAEKAGIPFPTYRGIEYGKVSNPGILAIAAIAKALQVPVDDLLGEKPASPNAELHALIDRLDDDGVQTFTTIILGWLSRNETKNRSVR